MALNIRNPEADRLASEVAALSGQTKTAAVIQALRERLYRLEQDRAAGERGHTRLADRLDAIALYAARRPLLDRRSADEILGYEENGLPE